jgi:hypothetical protein
MWEIEYALLGSKELTELLEIGFEPFGMAESPGFSQDNRDRSKNREGEPINRPPVNNTILIICKRTGAYNT